MNTTLHWLTTAFDRLVGFLPNLIAGLVILALGWAIAAGLARVTRVVARRLGFQRLMTKLGVSTVQDPEAAPRWLGSIVYAIVMLVAVLQASRAWQLDFVANGLAAVMAYLPHVFGAAIVFGAALLIGNWVRDRFYRAPASEAGPGLEASVVPAAPTAPRFLPGLVRGVIIAIGAFMALRELQIAPEIVNAAFMLTLGALAVASALAFGLGGREVAGRAAQSWWERRAAPTGRSEHAPLPSVAPGVPARPGVRA